MTRLENLLLNPDADDPCLKHAIANVAAFIDELNMEDPPVAITMQSPEHDRTGRYAFKLHRGICEVDVDMPGLPLYKVQCAESSIPRGCPRLYVDGNSWWWCYALDIVRVALGDHDGTMEQQRVASERAAEAELDHRPRCATCSSVRSLTVKTGLYTVQCYTCEPEITTHREAPNGAVYLDDGWKSATHYLVRRQHMPPEVPGHENPMHPDALCGATVYTRGNGTDRCRRRARHEGRCTPYWVEIERTRVVPVPPPRRSSPSTCW